MENSMKKILLSLMFIAVLSSVEIEAQTVLFRNLLLLIFRF